MRTHFSASFLSAGRAFVLASMMSLMLPACGQDDTAAERAQAEQQRQQLEKQVAELEAEVSALEAQLTRQEQESAAHESELRAAMDTLEQQLAEARELLESQDWDGVLVKLDAARAEVDGLKATLAATDGTLELNATLGFGTHTFELDKQYTTAGGDTLTFTQLRYWLSNVTLVKQDGSTTPLAGSYHLMEAIKEQAVEGTSNPHTLPANRREQVKVSAVPAGTYTGLRFSIGVDPAYNDDLSRQAGELHVLRNMTSVSWMWYTSYIFTKVHGQYLKSDGTADTFKWDTGTNASFRTVSVSFPTAVTVNSQKRLAVNLRADVAVLFSSLSPRTVPTIGATQTTESATLSDGYAGMFSLTSVENTHR